MNPREGETARLHHDTDDAVVITGWGAICAAGDDPAVIWDRVRAGRSAIGPIRRWDATAAPTRVAGAIEPFEPQRLVPDRKVHKLLRRTDVLGLYAATEAIADAGIPAWRERLDAAAAAAFNERTGVFVGSNGGAYENQYDYLPLLASAEGDLRRFGSALEATVDPLWLLRTLPNNVLCHVGIRHGFRGPNGCVTTHSVGGALALIEAAAAVRWGEADRAVVAAHESPIEPQSVLYYSTAGLLATDSVRPFDTTRSGSVLGEGAAALLIETGASARARGAPVLAEWLGGACTSEAQGLLAIRDDGDGMARAITAALNEAGIAAADVGMVVAHGNGTVASDLSEARAIRRILGNPLPPVTAFKWAFGHTLAASALLDVLLALLSLRGGEVPGIATLQEVDPEIALPVSRAAQAARSNVALVLSRGFGGMHVALLLRGVGA